MAFYIMVALFTGLIIGFFLYYMGLQEYVVYLRPISDIFLRLLRMIIVPLILSSIYMAVIGLGGPQQLGDIGIKAMGYYFITTSIAVFIGMILVNIFQPGVGADLALSGKMPETMLATVSESKGLFQTIVGVIVGAIPSNPFQAMVEGDVLQIIIVAMMVGVVALFFKEKAAPFTTLMGSLEEISLILTHAIMKLAPLGVGILMMNTVATSGPAAIKALAPYMMVVLVGLVIHSFVLLTVGSIKAKKNPFRIIRDIATPLMTAFSTCSSAATLPLTMASVQDNLGVSKKTSEFVLPFGATINMDGTALYESVAVIFIAQAYGIELGLSSQIIIFLTCSLAAVGAASIPSSGLITMSIVLKAVGLPLDGIGLILAVDRILDQFRTAVNVLGDCTGTIIIDSITQKNDNT